MDQFVLIWTNLQQCEPIWSYLEMLLLILFLAQYFLLFLLFSSFLSLPSFWWKKFWWIKFMNKKCVKHFVVKFFLRKNYFSQNFFLTCENFFWVSLLCDWLINYLSDECFSENYFTAPLYYKFLDIINLEGHQNYIIGTRVTTILMNGWIFPIGQSSEASPWKVCYQ